MLNRQLLSVVIIVKNEAEMLEEAISSVCWADEIVVLDSGSKDNTVEIALKYGAKVYQNKEWLGFGKQRQRAQEFATGNMILMIDADERVTPKLRIDIEQILQKSNPNKVYSIRRKNFFLGHRIYHSGWHPDRVFRLYHKSLRYNDNLIHESLNKCGASVEHIQGCLNHITCRDFISFQYKHLKYAETWAQEKFQLGKNCNLLSILSHTIYSFFKTFILRAGFLDGERGFILAMINAQYTFNKYSALWALNLL